ncbi:prephenate dehydratase [Nesterenkonia sp. NBAIMH1]|uniref:prephenate dehydratase n=1 Tax=Nesterenkonia sp. NBAIMH1 TaxID=2600320 RepID=UPI0011B84EBE|nr:prephenate dehydratase [Nesterenkonia sp. NBAIMH1]
MTGTLRYSFLGPEGTFTEAALTQMPGADRAQRVPASSVLAALSMVDEGDAEGAVVPIENSVEGGVTATLDAVSVTHRLQITAETLVPITFVLASAQPMELSEVTSVATHSHAWAQVRSWAQNVLPRVQYIPAPSTAAGAHSLRTSAPMADAAICAPLVAEQLGLHVIASGIEDFPGAVTRFVLVTKPGQVPSMTGADKTTVTIPLPEDRAGALMELLEHFATRGVNICRIESRPTGSAMGDYFFSMDLEGHIHEPRVADALAGIHRVSPAVRFLGSYPRADRKAQHVRPEVSEEAFDAATQWVASLTRRT